MAWQGMLDGANAEIEAGEKTLKSALKEYRTVCSAMSNPPSSDDEAPRTKRRKNPTPRVTQAKRAASAAAAANAAATSSKVKGSAR